MDATWAVFFIPSAILIVWVLIDWWLIKDTPEEADFPYFDTHDASSGQMHIELTTLDLLKKVFASPLMLLIAAIGLTSGIFRNGITQWYFVFAAEVKQPGAEFFLQHWGLLLCVFGIVGGFAGGMASDWWFRSRRGPPTAFLCGFVLFLTVVMAVFYVFLSAHSRLRGGAHRDVRGGHHVAHGRHGGDGFRRAQGGGDVLRHRGRLHLSWQRHPVVQPRLPDDVELALLAVFSDAVRAASGPVLAIKIWHDLPAATRKYLAEVG